MEAPLSMVVPSTRGSAPSVHPPFPSSSSSPHSPYGHHLYPAHWSRDCAQQVSMESNRRREQQHQLMESHQPINHDHSTVLQPTVPQAVVAQPSPTVPAATVQDQEMPQNENVDSAISANQGYKLKQIGMYTMHEKIGMGMYGAVRRAVHKVTKTEVAIKIVKKDALRPHKNALTRVYREIEVQKRLNHPFVLDIFQIMETECTIYLVTELCQGGELFNVIQKKKRLNEHEARKYFCQLVVAVQYCHERGVAHRDVKAENVLLDEFGNVKLADFGFSNFFDESGLLNTFCGSPQYAAPEVFNGKDYHGPQIDIWSMGVLLYVFLTGSTPFEGSSFADIQDRVLHAAVEYPYYVSHEAAQLMNLMMNRDLSRRATLRQVMAHRWVKHNDIPRMVKNSVAIYDYVVDFLHVDSAEECLIEMGISKQTLQQSDGRFDNVDGMLRLLVKEYRARRLRKVWADNETVNIVVAAQVLQSEGRRRNLTVYKINADPIHAELAERDKKIKEERDKKVPLSSFLPGPEDYPYYEFKEEEEQEKEENARMEEEANVASVETLTVEDSDPRGTRSSEIPNFEDAQQPAPVVQNIYSIESSEGYGGTGETSALSTVSPSLTSIVPPVLNRMPSDVCSRMGALDITQKRRGELGAGEQPPLPKRPSLPECLSVTGADGMTQRGALKLAAPPKKKSERKTFFEMMRLKRKKAHGARNDNGQSSSTRPNWFLPAPALPEGGSFDDGDDGKVDS